jgi:dipeptidyl aminopeptidase/acylaminoacyl peptidase
MRAAATVLTLLFAATTLTPAMGQTGAQRASYSGPPRLIERTAFFGNPDRIGVALSPDGKHLSWIAPRDGVLNVWVAPVTDPSKARPLTNERTRPIRSATWAPDSSMLMFSNDKGGDENFLLYGVNIATGEQKTLTPFEKTQARIVKTSRQVKDRILVGVNNRDPRFHDVHELNLKTGALRLVMQNEGFAGFTADENLELRIAAKPRADGGVDYHRVVGGKVEPTPFETVGPEDTSTTPIGFTRDGKTLYWTDNRGRDTTALFAQDLATGRKTLIAESARADIGGALRNPKTGRAEAYSEYYLKNEWKPLDPAVRADFDHLSKTLPGQWAVASRPDADDIWIVVNDPITSPAAYHRYDRATKRLTKLFTIYPQLEGAPLAPMTTHEIKSRDGLTLPSYLTLPAGSDPDGDGRPNKAVPMVLLVHGGPWARDGYGYNAEHQWLANRGYAVLSTNFRASTGFGKKFLEAGNGQWGTAMHNDLLDAVDWAVGRGVTTKDKVAIMGASYGGYATLWGMTNTPDRFACGVNIVGPSNLNTLLATIPPYWEAGKRQMYRRMADPTTEAGKAWLAERSPLTKAANIRKPLLIGQGANDPRVKQDESDQIVKAMQARKIPVTYVLFPDEGHGFARPQNNIAFNAVAENFLQGCLGGRAEPIGEALKPSTAQVRVGAEIIPGLQQGLPVAAPAAGAN